MGSIQDVIIRYREATENERLHLFLQYPDLREQFTQMELYQARGDQTDESSAESPWYRRLVCSVVRCCGVNFSG